jgi:N-formylglutamate amidohydrolase
VAAEGTMRRSLALWALGLVFACGGDAGAPMPTVVVPVPKAGDVQTDANGWVEYTVGEAPLIISAPHGGLLAPTSLPDRSCAACILAGDDNTQDLARRVAARFLARTGKHPHLVINLLGRSKFDANREVVEATGGNATLTATWTAYHGFIERARARFTLAPGRGLLLDLHGHGHAIPRLELGYLVSAASLRLSDQALGASGAIALSSVARLAVDAIGHPAPVALLRGPTSLGALFVKNGFASVPSPTDPAPAAADEYFTGGYTTDRHGSARGGTVDAIQIEAYRTGARDTPENLDKFAGAIVSSALEYLSVHYGWTPTTRAGVSARVVAPARGRAPGFRAWH